MAQIALRNASGWNVRKEILYGISHIVHHCIVCCGEFSIALGIWWSSGVQAESSPQHQYRNRAELTMCRGNSRNSHLDLFFIQNRLSQGEGRSKYIFDEDENNENKICIGFTIFNFDPLQIVFIQFTQPPFIHTIRFNFPQSSIDSKQILAEGKVVAHLRFLNFAFLFWDYICFIGEIIFV